MRKLMESLRATLLAMLVTASLAGGCSAVPQPSAGEQMAQWAETWLDRGVSVSCAPTLSAAEMAAQHLEGGANAISGNEGLVDGRVQTEIIATRISKKRGVAVVERREFDGEWCVAAQVGS